LKPTTSRVQQTERADGPLPLWFRRALYGLIGLLLFVLALELIKKGAGGFGKAVLQRLQISGPLNALGLGWLWAYAMLSGSPVAAVALAFFASGALDSVETFAMISGSRLGAALIVLLLGVVYYLRDQRRSDGVAIGILSLLTTAAIYLPGMALGYWLLTSSALDALQLMPPPQLRSVVDWSVGPLVRLATNALPGWGVTMTGLGALLLSLSLLDQALPALDMERHAVQRIDRIARSPWAMFAAGLLVTALTLSVSVSLALLVPLAARGLLRREHTLPYIMGANITTFIDTLVAALILGGQAAFVIVLAEMLSVAALSVVVLLVAYRPFARALLRSQEQIMADGRWLAAFVGLMLVVPLVLVWW
jgi:solute carrier family 34 (sodium-dependent phosphate cotransporter)